MSTCCDKENYSKNNLSDKLADISNILPLHAF